MEYSIIHIVKVVPPGLLSSSWGGGATAHPVPIAFLLVEKSLPFWPFLFRTVQKKILFYTLVRQMLFVIKKKCYQWQGVDQWNQTKPRKRLSMTLLLLALAPKYLHISSQLSHWKEVDTEVTKLLRKTLKCTHLIFPSFRSSFLL